MDDRINDPMLRPLFDAHDEETVQAALGTIIGQSTHTIRKLLQGYIHPYGELQPEDADDVASAVTVRLLRKLRACTTGTEEPILQLPAYVARQTLNAVNDHLRARFPLRARLKNRLRYVLKHDRRLALWASANGMTAGLARFRDTPPSPVAHPITRFTATRPMLEQNRTAEALVAILTSIGRPLLFDDLVRMVVDLWNVTDSRPATLESTVMADTRFDPHEEIDRRRYLQSLWIEIRELRPQQRAALLLNLRDAGGTNGLALFVLSRIASLEEIADVLGSTPAKLAEMWRELPLDDLTIAEMLGLTRQQVINLRSAARARLARRMSAHQRKPSQ